MMETIYTTRNENRVINSKFANMHEVKQTKKEIFCQMVCRLILPALHLIFAMQSEHSHALLILIKIPNRSELIYPPPCMNSI